MQNTIQNHVSELLGESLATDGSGEEPPRPVADGQEDAVEPSEEDLAAGQWRYLEHGGLRLRYMRVAHKQSGSPGGKPVLAKAGDKEHSDEGPGIVWLVFHGFGQTPESLAGASALLARQGRVLSIELPAHGRSGYLPHHDAISPLLWRGWINSLLAREAPEGEAIHIMGYSLGGRLALATAADLGPRCRELTLVAADGLARRPWFWLATGSALGRSLFGVAMGQPMLIRTCAGWLARMRLINKSLMRFVGTQLSTRAKRTLVRRSWLALRALPGNLSSAAARLGEAGTEVHFYAGMLDRVVQPQHMKALAALIPTARWHLLHKGHNALPLAAAEDRAGHPSKS